MQICFSGIMYPPCVEDGARGCRLFAAYALCFDCVGDVFDDIFSAPSLFLTYVHRFY